MNPDDFGPDGPAAAPAVGILLAWGVILGPGVALFIAWLF